MKIQVQVKDPDVLYDAVEEATLSPQGESGAEQRATLVSALEFESGLSASLTTGESGAGKDHDGHTPAMESSVTDPAPGFLPRKFSWAADEDCESLAAAQAMELP